MTTLRDLKISTLDLVPVRADAGPAQSLRNSLDLAQHAERFGYHRFWVAVTTTWMASPVRPLRC